MAGTGVLQLGMERPALVRVLRTVLSAVSRLSLRFALADGLPDLGESARRLRSASRGQRQTRTAAFRARGVGRAGAAVVVGSIGVGEPGCFLWIALFRVERNERNRK